MIVHDIERIVKFILVINLLYCKKKNICHYSRIWFELKIKIIKIKLVKNYNIVKQLIGKAQVYCFS